MFKIQEQTFFPEAHLISDFFLRRKLRMYGPLNTLLWTIALSIPTVGFLGDEDTVPWAFATGCAIAYILGTFPKKHKELQAESDRRKKVRSGEEKVTECPGCSCQCKKA